MNHWRNNELYDVPAATSPQACIEATDIPASRAIRQVYLGFQDEGR